MMSAKEKLPIWQKLIVSCDILSYYYRLNYVVPMKSKLNTTTELGLRLRMIRERNGLTAYHLHKVSKISEATLRAYEQGRMSPTAEKIVDLCIHLKVSSDYLLGLKQRETKGQGPTAAMCAEMIDTMHPDDQDYCYVTVEGFMEKMASVRRQRKRLNPAK